MISFGGRAFAALFAAWLYAWHPLAPFAIVSLFLLINIGVIAFMYDPPFESSASPTNRHHILDGRWYIKSHRWILYLLLFMIVGWSFAGDLLRQLYQPIATSWWISKEMISYLYILIGALSAFGSWFAGKMFGHWSTARFIVIYLWCEVLWALLLFTPWLRLRLFGMVLVRFVFGFYMVVVPSYINKHVPSSHRVTINSIEWFIYSGSYFIAGGSAGRLYSVLGEQNILLINIALPLLFLGLYCMLPRAQSLYDAR
jgi:predicted MFS family arabinose efflux permease